MTEPDAEYSALLVQLAGATPGTPAADALAEQLHTRYLAIVRGGVTSTRGYPYPDPTDPVAEGADAIRALAEAIGSLDQPWTVVPPASGWQTGTGNSQFAIMRRDVVVFTRGTLHSGTGTAATLPVWARPRATSTVVIPQASGGASTITINATGAVTFAGTPMGLSSGQTSWMVAN